MAARTASLQPRFDWLRTLALSSTFVLHLAAIAVVALPIAAPLVTPLPQIVPAVVLETKEPEKVLPQPPPPMPLPRLKHTQQREVAPATPVATPTPIAINTVPIESPMSVPAVADTPASLPMAGGGEAPAGETRTLAYDGALKLRYPQVSMRQREQGTVLLRVLVDAGGSVQRIEIERSSGHSQLDAAAREAVQRAHFRPVLRDGEAVQAWGIVPIEFRLDRT